MKQNNNHNHHLALPLFQGGVPAGEGGYPLKYCRILLILFLLLTPAATWGQTDYSGVYYIGSRGYNENTPNDNFYLCPTKGWAFYVAKNTVQAVDNGQPFLTTYKCRNGVYNDSNAIWIVEKDLNSGCYYIKQALTGKYIVSNGTLTGAGSTRARVHLESVANAAALAALGDTALFEITYDVDHYDIIPHSTYGRDGANNIYLVVNTNNYNQLDGNEIKTNGPTGFKNCGGIIGLYTHPDNGNAKFYFEPATIDPPTITNNNNGTYTITAATGATIYYTTDGTNPTTTDYTGTGTTPVIVNQTESMTVIKAIAKGASDYFPTIATTYNLPKCNRPVITVSGGTVTIYCATDGVAIHYTVNGDPATSSSTPYTGPFAQGGATTIRAIATKAGYLISSEAVFTPPITVHNSSSITNMSGNYILASDFTSTGPIGTSDNPFTGTIDGNMVTISGLTHPLVAYAYDATIKNVMLKNVTISRAGNVGSIVCEAKGYTRIYNCGILPIEADFSEATRSSVTATGENGCAGGLVGKLEDDSRVVNCFSYADVSSTGYAAGIVGNNTYASNTTVTDGKYANLRTMVVNCMFYGDITAGSHIWAVYGGTKITNSGSTAINNYNFYSNSCSFSGSLDDYNCSWPAQQEYLTRYEYHRYLLNSNRALCGWWVGAPSAPSAMSTTAVQEVAKDSSLMAKWVLDTTIAPYPILKPFGKYFSPINIDADASWRTSANKWEGKKLGSVSVTINPGSHAATGVTSTTKNFTITDMDTLHGDYCYRKIQLPYYNSVFGNPNGATWAAKYAGNYTDYVVTGWEITTTDGATGTFTKDWSYGYNFAARDSSAKDLYSVSDRIFAQGGYYYVPYDVTAITITAHWGKACYIANGDYYYDRVDFDHSSNNAGSAFAPAGTRSTTLGNGQDIRVGKIATVANTYITTGTSVYDNALVLVSNHQYCTGGEDITPGHGFTIMSIDLDFDEEPDCCLEWQLGVGTTRQSICPIRFDFLPIIEIGLGLKKDGSTQYYSLGCYRPLGHYEVTETALIHFGQFEFGNSGRSTVAPLILNGGIFEQYVKGTKSKSTANDYINYVIIGGNVYMPSFTPGAHVNGTASFPTRHCAVNVIGGRIDNLYLTGNYNENVTPNTDNPHCYMDGGLFDQVAAAGKEGINGNVYFRINHSRIKEFYGGSTMATKRVTGNIDVTIDSSIVTKYCGGPMFGDMYHENSKTITTRATGTTFTYYYGGGNGGTSYVQYDKTDGEKPVAGYNWGTTGKVNSYTPKNYINEATGYHADYDMTITNVSTGTNPGNAIYRTYFYAAQFSATNTGSITNTLTRCKVLKNFYGAGNLGGVYGDVTSTLIDTEVDSLAFGAGFSAQIPSVTIHNKDKTTPSIDVNTGIITPQSGGTGTTYTWTDSTTIHIGGVAYNLSTSTPTVTGSTLFYTTKSLSNLGTVNGNVTLILKGTTTVGTSGKATTGNVYGGGDESAVVGSTAVRLEDGVTVLGNVYGGGNNGPVGGNSSVTIRNDE